MQLETPYYLIDETRMVDALEKIRFVEAQSNTKSVLALKCFSAWCAFPFMRRYLAGTTSSSVYEARLGYEKFGGETHGYGVAFDENEARQLGRYCNKVVFNSVAQLNRLAHHVPDASLGLRLNPEIGHSAYPLSNPAGRYSRLGVTARQLPDGIQKRITGAMTHINCDNTDLDSFKRQLGIIGDRFAALFKELSWLSLGGGISFTDSNYPLAEFCSELQAFSERHDLQLYLEPGEAAVTCSTSLVVTVLDIVHNEVPTLIVDSGVEPHLLDAMTYEYSPELDGATALSRTSTSLELEPGYVYRVAGRTCLAGDLFGNYRFDCPVELGSRLHFTNVGGYSMVKKNYFNGIRMPAIYHKAFNGELRRVTAPSYEEFRDALS